MIDDRDFHQVLCPRPRLNVVSISLRDSTKEVDRVRVREVESNDTEYVSFGFEDFFIRVSTVGHVEEVGN